MNFKKFFLSSFLLFSGIIYAQSDFRPGFIITNDNDTVYGSVDYRGDVLMGFMCRFRTDGKTIATYYPGDIQSYGFIDGNLYVARLLDEKKAFLECLILGKVSILFLRDENGDHYYIEKSGMQMAEIPYKEETRIVNSIPYQYASKTHIGVLTVYMQDAPSLQQEIMDIKKPEHKNLIRLAEHYNQLIDGNKKESVAYKKEIPAAGIFIEPYWGLVHYGGVGTFNEAGCFVYLYAPRTNERISIKTGASYQMLTGDLATRHVFKIPLQFHYIFPGKKLQPRVGLGANLFFRDFDGRFDFWTHSLAVNLGLNYRISDKWVVFGMYQSDFTPLIGYKATEGNGFANISYGISLGTMIKLK
ncbi:MAG: hypothetical protein JXA72_12250 [Bacteroidales bacterium]|nr:hypothetical protein [Bacteroidales bacterium]